VQDTTLSIIIAGDVVPSNRTELLFSLGDIESLLGKELVKIFSSADIASINLECPLTNSTQPLEKRGPNLKAVPETIRGIKALNPSVVGLANNHIMDFGETGLSDTIEVLEQEGLAYVGVGKNVQDAAQSIHIVAKNDLRIGFYACTEHEFSIATSTKAGANPFDPLITGDTIALLKASNRIDVMIILYHGGKEYYQYPSPDLQKTCRHLVEKGADLVVCQHSHCIGAYEHYLHGDIVYGQGNFLFDMNNPISRESLLLSYTLNKEKESNLSFLPIKRNELQGGGGTISLAEGVEGQEILDAFISRSKEILEHGSIERHFEEYSESLLNIYLSKLSPFGKIYSKMNKYLFRGRLFNWLYPKEKLFTLLNFIECEAHREVLNKGLSSRARDSEQKKSMT